MDNKTKEFITVKDLWEIFINNIWLFVISVVISISIGIAYIVITPPMYQRNASILIKDNEQGKSISTQATQGFEDMGMFQSNTNINNEIHVLRTTAFMSEVVKRLGLEYNYKVRQNGVRWIDLYTSTPFKVELDSNIMNSSISFEITFSKPTNYIVSEFTINGEDVSGEFEGKLGEEVTTPYGGFLVEATPFLSENKTIVGNQYIFSKSTTKATAKKYLQSLSVILRSDDASIIDLSITDENTERADNILNTLISIYNENWIKDKNEVTFNTSGFIDDRLSVIQYELEGVDGSIADFKSEQLMPDVAAVASIQLQQTTNNNNEQLVVKNQLSMARYIQEYLQDDAAIEQLLPVNTGIESGAIESMIGKYNELLLQKNMLLSNSGKRNPLVADMIVNLRSIKSVINTSINDHISTLIIRLKNLESEDIQHKQNLSSTPKQAKKLLGVERQQKIKEELFLYLLQKREENELSQAFSAYNTKILSVADGSPYPIEPKKAIILLFALVIGVILPIFYLIIKESLDTSITSKMDLDGLSKIPFVGSIPHITPPKGEKKSNGPRVTVVSSGNRDVFNESFRVLRSNLDFMTDKSGMAQVIQLISINPGSGKSFITINLGLSMALKDAKVLLIDADIRKATLSSYLNVHKTGISEYLSGENNNIDELILKSQLHENLDILSVGKIPPNPSELLLKAKLGELITEMKTRYDYIFLDCPPVDIVPDAAIIGKFCNTAIFVVRAGLLDKRLLPDIEALYESKKYNNMCLLLNGVRYSGKGYYGYRRYGYYGYGTENKK